MRWAAAVLVLLACSLAHAQTMQEVKRYHDELRAHYANGYLRGGENQSAVVGIAEQIKRSLSNASTALGNVGTRMHPGDDKRSTVESFRSATRSSADTAANEVGSWIGRVGASGYTVKDSDVTELKASVDRFFASFDVLDRFMRERLKALRENSELAKRALATARYNMDNYVQSKTRAQEELKTANQAKKGSWQLVEYKKEQVRAAEQRHAAARERVRAAGKNLEDLRAAHLDAIEAERQADQRMIDEVVKEDDGKGAEAAYQAWLAADERERDLARRVREAVKQEADARKERDEAARDEAQAQGEENEAARQDRDNLTRLGDAWDRYSAVDSQQAELNKNLIAANTQEAIWTGWYLKFQEEIRE